MKRLVSLAIAVLLTTAILSEACTTKVTPPAAPPQPVIGTLKDINTPSEPGKDVITVQTPQGEKTLPITSDTTFTLEGKTCTIDQLAGLELANVSYNCTLVIAMDPEDTHEIIVGVDVTKIVPPK